MGQKEAQEAVNCLRSLSDYEVLCPAGSCEKLGEYYLRYEVDCRRQRFPVPIWSRLDTAVRTGIPAPLWETALR